MVSRAGAIPEVVGPDGRCADQVAPGDTEELAAALARMLADPDRRAAMGTAGRARVLERYSWSSVARSTAECYAEVADVAEVAEVADVIGEDRAHPC